MKAQHIDAGLTSNKGIRFKKVDLFYLDTPFHFHDSCELVFIEEGFGKRVVGDNVAHFTKGDLVLMGPNLPHIWQNDSIFYHKKKGYHVKATVIYFSPLFLMNLTDDHDSTKTIEILINKSARGLYFKSTLCSDIAHKISLLNEVEGLQKISNFLSIIDSLATTTNYEFLASDGYKNSYNAKDTARFNDVYQYIINNFHHTISLTQISSVAHMSPTAFCRYFKNHTQKSLTRFINEVRVGHACLLLQKEEYSIAHICFKCGYNNMVNFNKFFKSITGKTPSEFRKDNSRHP